MEFRIAGFVILVCLTIAAVDILNLSTGRSETLHQNHIQSANLARSVAQQADDTFLMAGALVTALADRFAPSAPGKFDPDVIHGLLVARAAEAATLHAIHVFDAAGQEVADSTVPRPAPFNAAHLAPFLYLQQNNDPKPHIDKPVRSMTGNTWVVPVSYRMNYPDGTFAGIVVATIDMDYFQRFYRTFDIGKNGSILLAFDDGTLAVRYPFVASMIGQPIAKWHTPARDPSHVRLESFEKKSVIDGVTRLSDSQSLECTYLIAVVSIAKDDVLAPWKRQVYKHAAIGAFTLCMIGWLGFQLIGHIRRREKTERIARENDARYQLLAEHSTDIIARFAPDGRRLYISPSVRTVLGHEPKTLIGRYWNVSVPLGAGPQSSNDADWHFARALAGESSVMVSLARHCDGREVWLESVLSPIRNPIATAIDELIVISRDVTDRIEAERKTAEFAAGLAESSRLWTMAAELAHLGYWHLELETHKMRWSDEVFRIHGIPIGETPNFMETMSAVHEDDRPVLMTKLKASIDQGAAFSWEVRIVTPDGDVRDVAVNAQAEIGTEGRPVSLLGTLQDITAIKNLEREQARQFLELRNSNAALEAMTSDLADARDRAEAANRAKSSFLATMSHEIRTPMNGIMGMNGLLLSSHLTPEQRKLADTVQLSADALLTIIDDVLDVSKLEAGKIQIEAIEFDLPTLMERAVELLAAKATENGLDLTLTVTPNARGSFIGDPTRLRQIVLNLVSNAIKFTKQGFVKVTVAATQGGDGLTALKIEVADSGIGISEDAKNKLFQPFEQADSSITRRFGGTGLGLNICKKLTELMGGLIGVADRQGGGTVFWVALALRPVIVETVTVSHDDRQVSPLKSRGGHILLAEDNEINRQVARLILQKLGYSVEIACDGVEAVAAIERGGHDVVLMDVQMPNLDGLAATRQIRAAEGRLHRTPIIAMTANAMTDDRRLCLEAGMDDYVSKPFDVPNLHATIERWIGRQAPARKNPAA